MKPLGVPLIFSLALVLGGCGDIGYYAQCVKGHLSVMSQARPIASILDDPETPPDLRDRLGRVLEIRDFASRDLLLPDNGSYRSYADLGRPYVVWNVVATPEFSLEPLTWCFPVAGCVPYRGYFKEESAQAFADKLSSEGYDVHLYGVPAYSTLSWFNDPVLNTFCRREDTYLAALIFHELAHQKLYVKNDASFNEAFAVTVEMIGVERWLSVQEQTGKLEGYLERFVRDEEFVALLLSVRSRLAEVYAKPLNDDLKRLEKQHILQSFRNDYAALKDGWSGYAGYDAWMQRTLNNAHFSSVSTYRTLVPAFRALLARHDGELTGFYADARALAQMPHSERSQAMTQLLDEANQMPQLAADSRDAEEAQ